MEQDEKFYKSLEIKAEELLEKTNFKFISDLKNLKLQNEFLLCKKENIKAMVW